MVDGNPTLSKSNMVLRMTTIRSSKGPEIESLSNLAAKKLVKDSDLLQKYASCIPPLLYEILLLVAAETNRVLSIRNLILSWPLEELSITNCKYFTPEHATLIAYCLHKTWGRIKTINLSGCETGVEGTKLFLKLATGQTLPNLSDLYCDNCIQPYIVDDKVTNHPSSNEDNATQTLHLIADCYCSKSNYKMLTRAWQDPNRFNFMVSNLCAMELGFRRIQKLLKKMAGNTLQSQTLKGLNFAMNGLPSIEAVTVPQLNDEGQFVRVKEDILNCQTYPLSAFEQFSNLEYLNLSNNPIGQKTLYKILRHLHENVRLAYLIVRSCGIGPQQKYVNKISSLKCLKELYHLDLAYNGLQVLDGFKKIISQCANTLKKLVLEGNSLANDKSVLPLIQMLLKPPFGLDFLNISGNRLILSSDDIREYNVTYCPRILH